MSFTPKKIVLGPGEGTILKAIDHPITFKATKEDTGGTYSLFEATLIGGGPGQHIHKNEEEAFYVLEGEIKVKIDDEIITATAGSFVLIPRGTEHTFWRSNSTTPKLLVIISPAGFEDFFFEVIGDDEIDGQTMEERATAVSSKYDLTFTGPPLG